MHDNGLPVASHKVVFNRCTWVTSVLVELWPCVSELSLYCTSTVAVLPTSSFKRYDISNRKSIVPDSIYPEPFFRIPLRRANRHLEIDIAATHTTLYFVIFSLR